LRGGTNKPFDFDAGPDQYPDPGTLVELLPLRVRVNFTNFAGSGSVGSAKVCAFVVSWCYPSTLSLVFLVFF